MRCYWSNPQMWCTDIASVGSGDSGGPLISNGVVVGVLSSASLTRNHSFYTSTDTNSQWIRNTLNSRLEEDAKAQARAVLEFTKDILSDDDKRLIRYGLVDLEGAFHSALLALDAAAGLDEHMDRIIFVIVEFLTYQVEDLSLALNALIEDSLDTCDGMPCSGCQGFQYLVQTHLDDIVVKMSREVFAWETETPFSSVLQVVDILKQMLSTVCVRQ